MRSPGRGLRLALVAAVAVAGLGASSAMAKEGEGRTPGLPFIPCPTLPEKYGYVCPEPDSQERWGWFNSAQVGMTGSVAAKQWGRIPLTMLATSAIFYNEWFLESGPGEVANDLFVEAQAFMVSPKGSKDSYGDSAYIPVRTVAFGSIPVEVTLQVSQRRDRHDLPVPIQVKSNDQNIRATPTRPGHTRYRPTKVDDRLNVRVRDVKVDGVDVGLGDTCQTGPTARLRVESESIDLFGTVENNGNPDADFDPAHGHIGIHGGTLNGTVDIPAFGGCTTSTGDDLSPLLTSAIAGKANPVTLRLGALSCFTSSPEGWLLPTQPGATTPEEAGCFEAGFPPKVRTIPDPLPFPDHAPGAQQ